MEYVVVQSVPSPEAYCALRVTAGLSPKSLEAAKIGLPNSLYGVSVMDGDKLIAMGNQTAANLK